MDISISIHFSTEAGFKRAIPILRNKIRELKQIPGIANVFYRYEDVPKDLTTIGLFKIIKYLDQHRQVWVRLNSDALSEVYNSIDIQRSMLVMLTGYKVVPLEDRSYGVDEIRFTFTVIDSSVRDSDLTFTEPIKHLPQHQADYPPTRFDVVEVR